MSVLVAIADNHEHYVPFDGKPSWRDFWERETGRAFAKCAFIGCRNPAENGVPVWKEKDKRGDVLYIVPLCGACENNMADSYFRVSDDEMVLMD
jgi:hypothetical protein